MPTPSRFPNGIANAAPWQHFAGMGVENPFFYHQFYDDFDTVPSTSIGWTATGTGTVTQGALNGGVTILTTTAVAAEFEELQRTQVSFQPVSGKKLYFVARVTLSDVLNSAFLAGLMPLTATPFTNPANGIWISKASGSTTLNLNVANNSVVTTTAFPAGALTLTNAVSFDVGFEVTANYNAAGAPSSGPVVRGSVGPNLVGYVPQSGNGSANSTNRAPNIISTAPLLATLQATVLAPVLAVQAGTTTIKTMTVDFVGAFEER
jgi:hypothetical protein